MQLIERRATGGASRIWPVVQVAGLAGVNPNYKLVNKLIVINKFHRTLKIYNNFIFYSLYFTLQCL
jgi:hypothetical protein